jgi:hypothetical protein
VELKPNIVTDFRVSGALKILQHYSFFAISAIVNTFQALGVAKSHFGILE